MSRENNYPNGTRLQAYINVAVNPSDRVGQQCYDCVVVMERYLDPDVLLVRWDSRRRDDPFSLQPIHVSQVFIPGQRTRRRPRAYEPAEQP